MGRDSGKDDGIWHVGAAYNFNNDPDTFWYVNLYPNWDGERNSDDDGWTVGLNYKGAQASDAGSYGIFARYYDQGEGTYWEHTTDANTFWNTGFKGYAVGANYAVAKNIVGHRESANGGLHTKRPRLPSTLHLSPGDGLPETFIFMVRKSQTR